MIQRFCRVGTRLHIHCRLEFFFVPSLSRIPGVFAYFGKGSLVPSFMGEKQKAGSVFCGGTWL
uniref:Uncharacterized protein n=1 Tax=Arundo donax TaxID=35708 RepID=A0A0A8XWL1_ARUDO